MNTKLAWSMAGVLGLAGLALLGCGTLAGCSGGNNSADTHEGHGGHDMEDSEDGHMGHDHGSEPASTKEAAAPHSEAMKPIEPSADYPLKTCVVSGEPLDSMDSPIAFEYDGTEIQFCCEACVKDFRKDPAGFLEKVRAAKK